jgi:outer membrane protein
MNLRIYTALTIVNLIGLLVIVYFFLFGNNQKIYYVDSAQLVHGYQGMSKARKAFQKKTLTWKANVDTLASEVQKQIMKYEKEIGTMTAKEKQLSQELIKAKQNQLIEYQHAMNTQAQQEDEKMTNEVIAQINAYIKKYGEGHNYKIIMAATQYGNIAYADEGLDITKEVLEGLNKEYAGQ